jgi:alpha-galactosidase
MEKAVWSRAVLPGAIGWLVVNGAVLAVTAGADEKQLASQFVSNVLAASSPGAFSFVYDGKPSTALLKSWQTNRATIGDEETVTWTDPASGLVVRCVIRRHADVPAVDYVLHLTNTSAEKSPMLDEILPLDWRIPGTADGCVVHHANGDSFDGGSKSNESFRPIDTRIGPSDKEGLQIAPQGGRSSDTTLPFFNVEWQNQGVVVAVGWSGQWKAMFNADQASGESTSLTRLRAGMRTTHLRLNPGESIRTPRILLVFWQGAGLLRGENLLRQTMLAHYCPRRDGQVVWAPICASVNKADPDGTYEGPHIRVMPALAERGIEVFWSDMDPQQWYPGGFPGGTGNWTVDPKKYPRGLSVIGEAAHRAGLKYLLWFEPERVAPNTMIDREHPEWVMRPASGGGDGLFRLHDEKARRWLTDLIDRHVSEAQLDWVRWDFNISPLGFWQRNDEPDRQGVTEIRHIEGLYAMWDELRARHPGLMIDNCASGGRRIDLETCSRSVPLWHSDYQCASAHSLAVDQAQNSGLWRWVPLHSGAAFGYEPSYAFRSGMTSGNILCVADEKNGLNTAVPETADAVRRTVDAYKRLRPFLQGDFYPLFAHSEDESKWFGYQFHRSDLNAGVAFVFRREKCPTSSADITLQGVEPDREYEVSFDDGGPARQVRTRANGLKVELATAPGACMIFYKP